MSMNVSKNFKFYLQLELALLFFVLPMLLFFAPGRIPKIPMLGAATLYCIIVLWKDKSFDRSCLKFPGPLTRYRKSLTIAAIAVWLLVALLVLVLCPGGFMAFPLRRPLFWGIVFVCYPFLSALPQEFIYRVFFFQRYAAIIPYSWAMVIMSSITFALLHIIYDNIPAVALSLAGGFLFARTYARSRSLAVVAVEHAIYGLAIFTLGLGRYFYESS